MKLRKKYKKEYEAWKYLRKNSVPCDKAQPHEAGKTKCCKRWQSFERFLTDMDTCNTGYVLELIDPQGDYEPANCRWIRRQPQQQKHKI